eukprot:6926153-Prorocentrum_lima.AAC.1
MTSSLVGSEMCIRDRPKTSRPAGAATGLTPKSAAARRSCVKARGIVSVSYTHLTLPTICSV